MFRFKALLWESIILVSPLPTCKAYPIAILLHDDHWAIYALLPLTDPAFVCREPYPYNIGDGNIVFKGQAVGGGVGVVVLARAEGLRPVTGVAGGGRSDNGNGGVIR